MQNKKILFVTALSVGSLGLALASGCSSSSSPATNTPEGGGEDVVTTSSGSSSSSSTSSSSGAPADAPPTCMSASTCGTGQICCGNMAMSSMCATGPCPATAIGPVQLCATSAECFVAGQVCAPNAQLKMLLMISLTTCGPATGDAGGEGGTHEGGAEGGSSSSGGDSGGTETGSDAPTGG